MIRRVTIKGDILNAASFYLASNLLPDYLSIGGLVATKGMKVSEDGRTFEREYMKTNKITINTEITE